MTTTTKTASKRHRWHPDDVMHGRVRTWRCTKCGATKWTEYDCEVEYTKDGRTWRRYAPSCPPGASESRGRS